MKIWLHRANKCTWKRRLGITYSREIYNRTSYQISERMLLTEDMLNTGKRGGCMSDLTESGYLSDSFVGVCSSAFFFSTP